MKKKPRKPRRSRRQALIDRYTNKIAELVDAYLKMQGRYARKCR